jgi:hypothetical protein
VIQVNWQLARPHPASGAIQSSGSAIAALRA